MNGFRRLASVVAVSGVAVAFAAPSSAGAAPAAKPEVYVGSASATGLQLALSGQTATVGQTASKVTSQINSSALGEAVMSVLGQTEAKADLTANGALTDGPHCDPVLSLTVAVVKNACTTATSTIANGLGHATTQATVDGVSINLNSVLSSTPLNSVSQTLTQTLQGIVNQLPAPLQKTLNGATDTVGGVLSDVLQTPTATLKIGDSNSDVATTAGQVVSTAVAKGGELDILPAPAALNGAVAPLASVIIGSSTATATYDRATGKATPSFDPALVTVKLGATPLTPAVTIPVTVGQTQTIALPANLGSITIQVADGSTFTNPDGTVGAVANAVKLGVELVNQPLVNLAIAGAQATVAGSPAVAAPPVAANAPAAVPARPTSLPRTGGSPWIPLAGGIVLAAFLITRRMTASAH